MRYVKGGGAWVGDAFSWLDRKVEPEDGGAPKRRVSFISRKMNDPQLLQRLEPSKPDLYSRVLFPLTFAVFNVFYWVYYLTKENLEERSQWQSTQVATLSHGY